MGRQGKIQGIVGAGLLGLSGLIALVPLAGLPAEVAYGALGPGIAGLVNLSLGLGFAASSKRNGVAITLSDPAAGLLRALVIRSQVWQGGWRSFGASTANQGWVSYKAPLPPSASALNALERAAEAHNRVTDALGEAKDERSARLRSAADAGMGEALHLAAKQKEDVVEIERIVVHLTELADFVAVAGERPDNASALRSNLEATLEELRAEDQARRELRG